MNVESSLKKLIIEYLGPLGEKEFEDLRIKGLVKSNLFNYIDVLAKQGIITKDKNKEFKNQVILLLEGDKKSLSKSRVEIKNVDIRKFIKK